jgi:hypothetical protein
MKKMLAAAMPFIVIFLLGYWNTQLYAKNDALQAEKEVFQREADKLKWEDVPDSERVLWYKIHILHHQQP